MRKFANGVLIFVVKYWIPFIAWAIVIYSFSSNPTVKTSEVHWQDFVVKKSAHLTEYFIFSLLLYRGLINTGVNSKKAILIVILSAFLYGLTDEFHQSYTPGREPKIRDVLIDSLGSIFFVYSLKKVIIKSKKLANLARMIQLIRD